MNDLLQPEPSPDDLDPRTWTRKPEHRRCACCGGHGYVGEPLSLSTRHDTTEACPVCEGTGWEP